MEELQLLEGLFDRKMISVLRLLFRDRNKQLFLQEISEQSKVPMATSSRILARLSRLDIIEVNKVSRTKLYRLKGNRKVDFLSEIFKEDLHIMKYFVSHASGITGINRIVLHGTEQQDRANVLLIGQGIDHGEVKRLCSEIRERYRFAISDLSLTEEQYYQMTAMGLYSGDKKMLFDRRDSKGGG
jgi:DNA-binding transcriptional ArsR family regulator